MPSNYYDIILYIQFATMPLCKEHLGVLSETAWILLLSINLQEDLPSMVEDYGTVIDFAHRLFVWSSEAVDEALVHCVIVGVTVFESGEGKFIYDENGRNEATHINPYLYDAPGI